MSFCFTLLCAVGAGKAAVKVPPEAAVEQLRYLLASQSSFNWAEQDVATKLRTFADPVVMLLILHSEFAPATPK
jgi:hypothetical protein